MAIRDLPLFKVVLLGDAEVGKTSVLCSFISQIFNPKYCPTFGGSFATKEFNIDNINVEFVFWDTSGLERCKSSIPIYFRSADSCILVYDVSKPESFEKIKTIHDEISNRFHLTADFPFLLLGNKSDLSEKAVQKSTALEYAKKHGNMLFYEVSSKTCHNIQKAFESIIRKTIEKHLKKEPKNDQNNHFTLKTECVKKLPFDKYEKNFTFNFNGKKYHINRIIADLISPHVCNMHYSDPTIDEFYIENINNNNSNENENDYFEDFLSFSSFENIEIDEIKRKYFIHYLYKLGNNEECLRLLQSISKTINEDNILEQLQTFSKMIIEMNESDTDSSILQFRNEMIQYASEHFEEFDREEMSKLPYEILDMIFKNKDLTLNDEDSILEFILELYRKDHLYSDLFENVFFNNVSEDKLHKFINEIKVDYNNDRVFQSICQRFFINNNSINEKRYNQIKTIKEFNTKNEKEFDGILSYLTKKTGGNIHDNGTINITSNSIEGNHHPKNAFDYKQNNFYHSNNQSDSYVIIDFKDKSVQVSSYLIQSASENSVHLKNWVIEVSENGKNWIEIDRQSNDSNLNGFNNKKRFYIKKPHRKFYQFLRLRENGESWNQNYIGFAFIEIYGKIQEPKNN